MKRSAWLALGLFLLSAVGAAPRASIDRKPYDVVGMMAVQQQGRAKPFDTLARESVMQIHGDAQIAQLGPNNKVVARWSAVSALLDWSARPEFWDEQDIILVRYLPLKQALMNEAARDRLKAVAEHAATPQAARTFLESIAAKPQISSGEMKQAATQAGLTEEARESLRRVARKLSTDLRWLAPNDIEEAVVLVDGKKLSFGDWFKSVLAKNRAISMSQAGGRLKNSPGSARLSNLETKLLEVGQKLVQYKALRDKNGRALEGLEIEVTPRPANAAYVNFTRSALLKAPNQIMEIFPAKNLDQATMDSLRSAHSPVELSDFEINVVEVFEKYIDTVKSKERRLPGSNKEADANYIAWIKDNAAWVPLRFVLDQDLKDLEQAGFDKSKIESFRSAYRSLEESERSSPGQASLDKAQALVASARVLGSSVNGNYPTDSALALETHYNRAAPFYLAPWPYGLALGLFVICVGMMDDVRRGSMSPLGRGVYRTAMAALVIGVLVEVYGFYLRIMISGWAPVTNMYETVIWVALVVSVLGLVLELIYRRVFAALAASGVSLLATVLAANLSEQLLDPRIKSLTPVLRSNYWLTIHVLTIVSSYAAFALAMGLGLLAVGYYLTATYRRSARFSELATPLAPGAILLIPGAIGVYLSLMQAGPAWLSTDLAYYVVSGVAGLGGVLTIMATFAMIGEAANRDPVRTLTASLAALVVGAVACSASFMGLGSTVLLDGGIVLVVVGVISAELGWLAFSSQIRSIPSLAATEPLAASAARSMAAPASTYAAAEGSSSGGGVATLTKPTVSEIRSRPQSGMGEPPDERSLAMQATAARIKPISNFLYRAMQVGVLLVAAGTMLGGVWADVSWGRFWGWDPKEVWALITLLVYLIPLHGRFAGWVNTFGLVVASVVCFGSVLMAWYGVNFVLGVGLHSYGFSEGGGQGVVLGTTAAVIAVVFAAAWRRAISQYRPAPIVV
jgi:ABC-type transport system involved in cytochrome c biogenesis permease subunit